MQIKLLVILLIAFASTPVFGQSLSDRTGLVNRLDVEMDGHVYKIETVANFNISDFEFDASKKHLTIYASSSLENNLGEMIIPRELLNGNFTFYLNDAEFSPKIKSNDQISFITLNFTGIGTNKIDIIATSTDKPNETPLPSTGSLPEGGGCLVATATYGSELSPQVQQLRELRDNKILQTNSGQSFMSGFNLIYYSFSSTIADWERESPAFRELVKISLTPLITSLSILNYVNMDSEIEVLGYGISLILLNLGMYVVIPATLAVKLHHKISKSHKLF